MANFYNPISHASRLTNVLRNGHGKPEIDQQVKLDREGFDRLVTWIDLNAPYYPDYAGGAYRNNAYGRAPIDNGQLGKYEALRNAEAAAQAAIVAGRKQYDQRQNQDR